MTDRTTLAAKWGLPDTAAPADIAAAELRQELLVRSFLSQHPAHETIAIMRQFAERELGLKPQEYDPEGVGGVHWPAIWAAIRDTDHRYCRLARTENGVGWIFPPATAPAGVAA